MSTAGLSSSLCFHSLKIWFWCYPLHFFLCLYIHPSLSVSHLFFSVHLIAACAPWHFFRPSYPTSVDVRPGLIDQTINYPWIPSALLIASLTGRPKPSREKEERGGMGEWSGEGERVSSKLLIKYESILCHLSGHASTSPLRAYRGRWGVEARGKSIRRTEGRDKCLIHQSNYIIAIKERQLDIMGWAGWVHVSASFSHSIQKLLFERAWLWNQQIEYKAPKSSHQRWTVILGPWLATNITYVIYCKEFLFESYLVIIHYIVHYRPCSWPH